MAPVAIATKVYSEPDYSAPVHSEPDYSVPVHSAPLHSEPVHSEPLYSEPSHNEPIYGQRLSYGLAKQTYGPAEGHFSPALSDALMANAYEAPILKSAYVPDYASSEYDHVSVPNGHYGARSSAYHSQQYPRYY